MAASWKNIKGRLVEIYTYKHTAAEMGTFGRKKFSSCGEKRAEFEGSLQWKN